MAVVFKADSDFSKVLKDYEAMQRRVVTLEERLRGVTKEASRQDSTFKSTFESGASHLKMMVGSYLSLHAGISQVNQALEEQRRLSAEANKVQMTAADAQAEIIKNLGNVSTDRATKFISEIEKIAHEGGAANVAPVFEAAAQTVSAVGNEQMTKSIIAESLPFFKNKLTELPTFAGAVGDLATISGAQTQEDIRRVVALVLSSQRFSRGATLDSFKNVAPAVAAVAAVDSSGDRIRAEREALALNSAISTSIADPDMALTKTATAEVATALAELLPEKSSFDADGKELRRGTGLRTMAERLAAVQADVNLQRRFFDTGDGFQMASFRGPIRPVIQELVSSPSSPIAKKFREAFEGITDDTSIVSQMRTNLETATSQLQLSRFSRKTEGILEKGLLDTDRGSIAAIREKTEKGLQFARGSGGIFQDRRFAVGEKFSLDQLESLSTRGGTTADVAREAEQMLAKRRQTLLLGSPGILETLSKPESQLEAERAARESDPAFRAKRLAEMSEGDRQQIELLTQLILEFQRYASHQPGSSAAAAAELRNQREGM